MLSRPDSATEAMFQPFDLAVVLQGLILFVSIFAAWYSFMRKIDHYFRATNARLDRVDTKLDMVWVWFKREHDINGPPTEKKP